MVKDIAPLATSSSPQSLTALNGALYFNANDGTHGYELWKSDGTAAGTVLLEDINTGANDSFPQNLRNANGALYFQAIDGIHGAEIWKSDGTAVGTVMVKEYGRIGLLARRCDERK